MGQSPHIQFILKSEKQRGYGEVLAERFHLHMISEFDAMSGELCLCLDEDGLSLVKDSLKLIGDFSSLKKRIRPQVLNGEMLIKAAKLSGVAQGLTLVDATAGMGEDAFLLSAAGFQVTMMEQDPVIGALLSDTIRRAENDPDLSPIVGRMTLMDGDCCSLLKTLPFQPDVIYLDPMFPKRKKSGAIKKKFQLLQCLESPCEDGSGLLEAALSVHPKRIVIKRPSKAPYLGAMKPNYAVSGPTIRYDCIVNKRS